MSDPKSELEKLIDSMLDQKMFTGDHLKSVVELRDRAAELERQNKTLSSRNRELENSHSESRDTIRELRSELSSAKENLQKLQSSQVNLDKSAAVAQAQSAVYKECFGLVFRNTEIRRSVSENGMAPAGIATPPGGYPAPYSAATSNSKTITESQE